VGTDTDTDSIGSALIQQGTTKEGLAETGASDAAFLLIGAATMIAGGIGFRMMPRPTDRGGDIAG
jgi:hypothetical protein